VRRAYLDLQAAQQQVSAARAQLRAAQRALDATEQRYRVGAATLVELAQARATQVQAQSALIGARYDVALQRTMLAYSVGDLDPQHVALG
jgi:outer membrane protein